MWAGSSTSGVITGEVVTLAATSTARGTGETGGAGDRRGETDKRQEER